MRDNVFQRITALLDEIAMTKEAGLSPKPDSFSEVKKTDPPRDPLLQEGSLKYPDFGEEKGRENVGKVDYLGVDARLGSDTPEPSRVIGRQDQMWDAYKHAKHASSVPVDRLLQDAVTLGNAFLQEILEEDNSSSSKEDITEEKKQASSPSTETTPVTTSTPTDENSINELAAGVLYGIQKQAEFHASLVGDYLFGNIFTKLALKKFAEASENLESKNDEEHKKEHEENSKDSHGSPTNDVKPHEEDAVEKTVDEAVDAALRSASEENNNDNDKDQSRSSENKDDTLDEAAAEAVLRDMVEGSDNSNRSDQEEAPAKEVLDNLASVLFSSGVGLDKAAGISPKLAKAVSLIKSAYANGTLHIGPPRNLKDKVMRDYMTAFLKEALFRSNTKGSKVTFA